MASTQDFAQNKKELLEKLDSMKKKVKEEADAIERAEVIVYAQKSVFIDGLVQTLEKKYKVRIFSDVEEASAYCTEHLAENVILDMDLPTDWRMSTDVFTTVKTLRPDVHFMLCTKSPHAVWVETLAAQKAKVLVIPFSADELFAYLKKTVR
jgi:DNA-binding NtrC family response regulator